MTATPGPSRRRWLRLGDLPTLMLGNGVEAGLRFLAFLVYSQAIGPAGVGLVVAVLAITRLASQVVDFGVDTSVISLGSKAFGRGDLDEARSVCRAGFNLHLWIGSGVLALGALASPLLAARYFAEPALAATLLLAFVGVPVERLADFNVSVLRTYQRFRAFALAGVAAASFVVVAVAGLAWAGRLNVLAVVVVTMLGMPLVKFGASWFAMPAGVLRPGRVPRSLLSRVLGFGKWIYGTALAESGMRRVNVLLLQGLAGSAATGYFHTAGRYADFLSLIFDPLGKYLVPKLTALPDRQAIRAALRRTYAWLGWTLLLIPAAWLVSRPLFLLVQGEDWLPAVPIFRIMVIALLVALQARPLYYALFSLGRPDLQTWIQVALFVAFVPSAWWAIVRWEALGSAVAILCVTLVGFAAAAWGAWRAIWCEDDPAASSAPAGGRLTPPA